MEFWMTLVAYIWAASTSVGIVLAFVCIAKLEHRVKALEEKE